MHRLNCIILRSTVLDNAETVGKALRRNFKTHRIFCSEKIPEQGTGDGEASKSADESNKSNRTKQAKARLDNLLKSIVQDTKSNVAGKKVENATINMKLAAPVKQKIPAPEETPNETEEEKETKKDLGEDMVAAVKQVAQSIGDNPQVVESELVQKLKTQVGKKVNLSDIFAGMKIDRSSKSQSSSLGNVELSRAHRVRRLLDERTKESATRRATDKSRTPVSRQRRTPVSKPTYVSIDLFGSPPLGIFIREIESSSAKTSTSPSSIRLATWDHLAARDLKLSVTHPPANGFEEMILWTEQGKLWKFPIDNEQGFEEESKVPFHDHVFLEPQVESWCPKRGPIRHFMELVCIGLSKNPFLTVKEKHEQIEWYHQYFKEKATIIQDIGAGEIK